MRPVLTTPDGDALAAYLGRLLHYDRAAAVRLRAAGPGDAGPRDAGADNGAGEDGAGVLGVFGRPPFDVLALRAVRVRDVPDGGVDATVSAGELLEGLGDGGRLPVPADVAAASWAGMLPPRGGWRTVAEPDTAALRARVAEGVAAFKAETEALVPERRTRSALDAAAARVWDAPVVDAMPLRLAHAARAMGFLPSGAEATVAVLRSGAWWRLRSAFGEIAHRRPVGSGLGLTVH